MLCEFLQGPSTPQRFAQDFGRDSRLTIPSPARVRPSDRVPVRTASLFLLGQPGFGEFVDNMVLGRWLSRLDPGLRRCGDFRILCSAHLYFSFMA
jgi:hypothetical protein